MTAVRPPHPATHLDLDPPTAPVTLPVPARPTVGPWLVAAALAVLLALGVAALARPDMFGLPSAPLFSTGEPAPGAASSESASGPVLTAPASPAG